MMHISVYIQSFTNYCSFSAATIWYGAQFDVWLKSTVTKIIFPLEFLAKNIAFRQIILG